MAADEATSVKVALRIRPQLAREKIEACRICTYVTPGEPQVTLGKDKSFTYDYVFDTPTEQHSIYENCITSLIEGCFEGYNATVLAYGQTGSGKTYTMGTGFDVTSSPEQLGIIPRAMDHLFTGIMKRKKEAIDNGLPQPDFVVTAQFMELYNEELIDLFDTSRDPNNRGRSNIRIHEDASGNIYTVGVTSRQVSSAEETLQCLHSGALNRSTAATQMNSQSSRSHAIFTITIKQTRPRKVKDSKNNAAAEGLENTTEGRPPSGQSDGPLEFETLSAKFHFTDLAGSERLKRTGATGDRAKEGISINCGLLALGNVISALGDPVKKSSHVPYRDSKLTRLLQDSLGGNSCTLMVACISPSDSDFMETLSTLKYANRAKNIKNKVTANQDSASKQIQFFRQQIAALQLELTEYKTGKRIVGEDGVEAYNDMFQENSMLQKENNNFRMKIKAMQETLDNRNQTVISLTTQLAEAKIGNSGDSSEDAISMIGNYVKEIEELRSKLFESEAMCSSLRRKSEGMSPYGGMLHRSPTPMMMTGSYDYENTTLVNGKSVLDLAKEDIEKLGVKKDDLKKKKATRPSDKTKDENASYGDVNGDASEQSASEDDDASELGDIDVTTSEDESDDAVSAAHQEEFATITYEIDVKQGLVNELEAMQRRIAAMQRQYEEKLKLMAETIKATEMERDKVLKNLDSKSGGGVEKSNKIKAEYKKQIDKMKKDMGKLQEAKRNHDRLVREQSKSTNQLKSLRSELEQLKKSKVRLMRQMKEDQKKSKEHESRHAKEMMKLKRDFKLKSNEVRTLSSKNKQKDLMMKRKQEEVFILRRQLKPISGKYGKRQQVQQFKQQQQEGSRSMDSTYVVDKNGTTENQSKNAPKRTRKASSEFSSKTARLKLQKIQQKIGEAVVQRETISRIDRQMERLLKDRERMQRDLERLHRKKTKALVNKDTTSLNQIKDEENSVQENIDFVNEQIQECQLEVMQVEEAMEDNGVISSIVQYCSVNEARYMLENLIGTAISKSAVNVQTQNRLKDAESRLEVSEESAKQAHDLMRYILQERPNLDSSIAECLNDYMKATNSESSSSSRESSPERDEDGFQDATVVLASSTQLEALNNSDNTRLSAKEIKARRRTATPQELLHGMTSPIRSTLSPIDSPLSEKTFVCEDPPNSGLVTSTPELAADKTLTPISSPGGKAGAKFEDQESDSPRSRLGTYTLDVASSASVAENSLHSAVVKSNSAPAGSGKQSPSTETPPDSPVSSRSKGSIPVNVFSRLTTYAFSSPRSDKGRMNPNTSKTATPRSEPLVCTQVAEGHHKAVLCVQASDHLLFSGSKDRTVKVWNLVTGQEIMSLDGHPNNVNVVRYCPLTGLVYSVSLCYIKVWDIRSHARCVRVLSSSGGHQLPSNFLSNVSRTNRMPDNESQINDVKLSTDKKTLYCASTTQVKIWDLNKFSVIGKLTGHSGNIMTMAVPSNTNDTVITGAKDHFVKVYDIPGVVHGIVSPSKTLEPPHMDGVEAFAFSASENVLFSSSRDKSIKKWDMATKTLLKSEYQAHANWVCALDIINSDDGDEVLVSGGRGGVLKLWDLHSFGSIGSIRAHSDTINYIASNKTHIFTASSDRSVCVWKYTGKN